MPAENTATMIVWPKRCGHGGMVLELVEHFRPYWLGRCRGRQVTQTVPTQARVLVAGLSLAHRITHGDTGPTIDIAEWAGRQVTVLRFSGCVLSDAEIERIRESGVDVEVVDLGSAATVNRGER